MKKQIREPMRLFIAIRLSQPMIDEAADIAEAWFPQDPRGRYTRPENLHITLRFLGMCDPAKVEKITSAMAWTAALAQPFSLRIGRPGYFSKGGESILWLGLTGELEALNRLREDMDIALSNIGFPRESGPYRPHITLARGIRQGDPRTMCASVSPRPLGVRVGELVLMHSTRVDDELTYVPLARAPIGG
jgi:2'-5' RNA ligase